MTKRETAAMLQAQQEAIGALSTEAAAIDWRMVAAIVTVLAFCGYLVLTGGLG